MGAQMQTAKVTIDEKLAERNRRGNRGAKYFRAKDNDELSKIYSDIGQTGKIESGKFHPSPAIQKKFFPFRMAALALLFLELLPRVLPYLENSHNAPGGYAKRDERHSGGLIVTFVCPGRFSVRGPQNQFV